MSGSYYPWYGLPLKNEISAKVSKNKPQPYKLISFLNCHQVDKDLSPERSKCTGEDLMLMLKTLGI